MSLRYQAARGLELEAAWNHLEFLLLLGQVHAPVRFAQQAVGIDAVLGKYGMADAEAKRRIVPADELPGLGRDGLQALDLLRDLIALQAGKHQHELIAAHAGDIVVFAAGFLSASRPR